ncbi:unnamed protein product [Cylindrotheca closterium]|uniref:Anoctamin transmembrane domain-containing protein n=1 Tax=Cylindrotheca closterium TaxID=2856 RepID=A0AAD2JPS3_9STRA|nr:unnamed protein product [Cylindrotheca closterium]
MGRKQDIDDSVPDKDSDSVTSSRSEEDDEEWSEPFQKQTSGNNETEGVSNTVRVDFTGSLIDAAGRSVAHSELDDSVSSDLVNEIEHSPMYPSYSSRFLTGKYTKDAPVDEHGKIDFLKDHLREMTGSRRLALSLMDKKWYNPHAGKGEVDLKKSFKGSVTGNFPSIKRAWAYFEHATLMRYADTGVNRNWFEMTLWERFRYAKTHADEEFERAKPGEKTRPTRLYDWLATPHMQLGDFGLGFGIYFSTLRAITWILFLTGTISVFNIYFFASDEYGVNDPDTGFTYEGMGNLLRGSAVCTDVSWVPCSDCYCNSTIQGWAFPRINIRCFDTNQTTDGRELDDRITFVLKNRCLEDSSAILTLGMINYGVMLFLLPTIYILLGYYLERHAVLFDEDEQSAQDYSIIVKRPPPDARNPRKWRNYFEETFPGVEVVAVTCNLDNDLLVKALVARREILRRMEVYLEKGTDMDIDNLALIAAQEARNRGKYLDAIKAWFIPGLPELISSLVGLNTRIKGLAQLDYPCTSVFISFERENQKRLVLSKLSVGKRYIKRNDPSALEHPKLMFEGTVLNVDQATEPNSIRWEDLNFRVAEKLKQTTITASITIGAILVGSFAVTFAERASPGVGAAFTISVLNLSFPQLAKYITDFEGHRNESKLQTSLYIKIAAFRWVNTAVVTTYITPFTYTLLPGGLISQIAAIFFAEIVTTNVIQLTDVWGHFQRHVLAPREKTQDAMNRRFQGLQVELAERYTNMTKIMFLAFWYSSIFPGGMLLAAVALLVNYYTDRFSLMRSWQRAPRVGTEISNISLNYFFSTALFFLAVMSSFYWSAFPFDNLCPTDQTLNPDYYGTYNVTTVTNAGNRTLIETVDSNTEVYRFCNQDFILRPGGPDFPFIYREGDPDFGDSWMSEEQKFLSQLFGWTSIGFIALVVLKFLYGIYCRIKREFVVEHESIGAEQGIAFHEVPTIAGYVPQVKSNLFSYPLIVCDCDKLGDQLFDWTDPDQDYGYYDLTKDGEHILTGSNRRAKNSFDRVKYWPPKSLKKKVMRKAATERRVSSVFNAGGSVSGMTR